MPHPRLGPKAQSDIDTMRGSLPEYLLEDGWIGASLDDMPDLRVHLRRSEVGLVEVRPYSTAGTKLLTHRYLGKQGMPNGIPPCDDAMEDPPLITLGLDGSAVMALPVWAMLAEEAQQQGLSILVLPPDWTPPEGAPEERGEGVIGQPPPQMGSGSMMFGLVVAPDGRIGLVGTPQPQEEAPDRSSLDHVAHELGYLNSIHQAMVAILGADTQDGWYGAVPDEDTPEVDCDVAVGMMPHAGLLLLHAHGEKGETFLEEVVGSGEGGITYGYPLDSDGEYAASLMSWPALMLLARSHGVSMFVGVDCDEKHPQGGEPEGPPREG